MKTSIVFFLTIFSIFSNSAIAQIDSCIRIDNHNQPLEKRVKILKAHIKLYLKVRNSDTASATSKIEQILDRWLLQSGRLGGDTSCVGSSTKIIQPDANPIIALETINCALKELSLDQTAIVSALESFLGRNSNWLSQSLNIKYGSTFYSASLNKEFRASLNVDLSVFLPLLNLAIQRMLSSALTQTNFGRVISTIFFHLNGEGKQNLILRAGSILEDEKSRGIAPYQYQSVRDARLYSSGVIAKNAYSRTVDPRSNLKQSEKLIGSSLGAKLIGALSLQANKNIRRMKLYSGYGEDWGAYIPTRYDLGATSIEELIDDYNSLARIAELAATYHLHVDVGNIYRPDGNTFANLATAIMIILEKGSWSRENTKERFLNYALVALDNAAKQKRTGGRDSYEGESIPPDVDLTGFPRMMGVENVTRVGDLIYIFRAARDTLGLVQLRDQAQRWVYLKEYLAQTWAIAAAEVLSAAFPGNEKKVSSTKGDTPSFEKVDIQNRSLTYNFKDGPNQSGLRDLRKMAELLWPPKHEGTGHFMDKYLGLKLLAWGGYRPKPKDVVDYYSSTLVYWRSTLLFLKPYEPELWPRSGLGKINFGDYVINNDESGYGGILDFIRLIVIADFNEQESDVFAKALAELWLSKPASSSLMSIATTFFDSLYGHATAPDLWSFDPDRFGEGQHDVATKADYRRYFENQKMHRLLQLALLEFGKLIDQRYPAIDEKGALARASLLRYLDHDINKQTRANFEKYLTEFEGTDLMNQAMARCLAMIQESRQTFYNGHPANANGVLIAGSGLPLHINLNLSDKKVWRAYDSYLFRSFDFNGSCVVPDEKRINLIFVREEYRPN